MASSQRMWLSLPSMLVVSVFTMAFICSTEAMPQKDCSLSGPTNTGGGEFLTLVTERTIDFSTGSKARCVPFNKCCDTNGEKPSFLGLVDERTGNAVIDTKSKENNKCSGVLNICCTCVKDETPTPPTETVSTEPIIPKSMPKCGIRNEKGVKVRFDGFEDGQTQQGEFPWTVALIQHNDPAFKGGGSLVSPRVVITAGHKVDNFRDTPGSITARIGDWDINQEIKSIAPQNIDVEKILFHPKFKRIGHFYNVAILILKTEAVYGATVAPVCLPEPKQNFDGEKCFVTGWGKKNSGGDFQSVMKRVEVPILRHDICQAMFRETRLGSDYDLDRSIVCAGGGKEDACEGDGGAPLVCPNTNNPDELVLVGVVAFGIGCGVLRVPGGYGSVPESMDWIKKIIVLAEAGLEAKFIS